MYKCYINDVIYPNQTLKGSEEIRLFDASSELEMNSLLKIYEIARLEMPSAIEFGSFTLNTFKNTNEKRNLILVVALINNKLIAFGYSHNKLIDNKLDYDTENIYVSLIYVLENHRGKQIGPSILKLLIEENIKNNIIFKFFTAKPLNEISKKILIHFGFQQLK